MALWGNTDNTSSSPLYAPAYVDLRPNSHNRDLLFGNTTANAFINGITVGVFGVSAAEMALDGTRDVASVTVTAAGSGATARPTVAFDASPKAGGNAAATATAKAVSFTIANTGTATYVPGDTVNAAGGTAVNATMNTSFTVNATFVQTMTPHAGAIGSGYVNGDVVSLATGSFFVNKANATVTTGTSNTSVASLAIINPGTYGTNPTLSGGATTNSTGSGTGLTVDVVMGIQSLTLVNPGQYTTLPTTNNNVLAGGTGSGAKANILFGVGTVTVSANGFGFTSTPVVTITGTGLTGQTAIAVMNSQEASGVASSGWVLRTQGSGQKAGRVHYETLVAMRTIGSDASDDTILPE